MAQNSQNSLKLLVESEADIEKFDDLIEDEFLQFSVSQMEMLVNDLKIAEIKLTFPKFSTHLQSVVSKLKKAIYTADDSKNIKAVLLKKTLNVLRDKIDSEFRSNHASIIDWYKPSYIEKFFGKSLYSHKSPVTTCFDPYKTRVLF